MLVEVTDLRGCQFVYARAALIDDQQRQDVMAREIVRDALNVISERRRDVRFALSRKLHAPISDGVRFDAEVVEDTREEVARLLYGLALIAGADESGDHLDDVVDADFVDVLRMEVGLQYALERDAMQYTRTFEDVDTTRTPRCARLGQGWALRLLDSDLREVGNTSGGEFARDETGANIRELPGAERTAVFLGRLASTEAVFDEPATLATLRRSLTDVGGRHLRPPRRGYGRVHGWDLLIRFLSSPGRAV